MGVSWKALVAGIAVLAIATVAAATVRAQRVAQETRRALPMATVAFAEGSRIGVTIRDVGADDVGRLKIPAASGAIVQEVSQGSPAEKAGVKADDVIVEFDGERIRSVTRLVRETPAGRTVKMAVLREGGRRTDLSVTPEEQSLSWIGEEALGALRFAPEIERELIPALRFRLDPPASGRLLREFGPEGSLVWMSHGGRLGVSVEGLTPQLATYFGVKDGVLVRSVEADSPAAKAGVKAGDVITAADGKPVNDPSDLPRLQGGVDEATVVTLSLVRDRKPMDVKVKVEPTTPRRRTSKPGVPA
jgi:serine protease Do